MGDEASVIYWAFDEYLKKHKIHYAWYEISEEDKDCKMIYYDIIEVQPIVDENSEERGQTDA